MTEEVVKKNARELDGFEGATDNSTTRSNFEQSA